MALATATIAALTAIVPTPVVGAEAAPPRWRHAVSAGVKQVMRQNSIPGAIVGVWRQGRRPYVKAFGVRNTATRRKMEPGLYMRIGSETKTFTATAVLQLVDQGKVGLDDPISKYIEGVPNGDAITIRNLAEMRSGLVSYTAVEAWDQQFLSDPQRRWKPAELLAYAFSQQPLFAPGTAFNYSNSNYILLGLVVERVTGQKLSAYINRRILKRERMKHSVFPTGAAFPSPHAQGYTSQTLSGRIANTTKWDPASEWAAGALISTLGDLRRWARDVATGNLLSRATQRQRERFIPIAGMPSASYGLGLFNVNGWIGHNGSLPGYESLTVYLPSRRATMVVLLNSDMSPPQAELSTLVGEAITKVITPRHVYELSAAVQVPHPE